MSIKCPKHSFFVMSLKKRKKISGDHFMPSDEQECLLSCQMMPVSES